MSTRTKQGIIYFAVVSIPCLFFLYNQLWIPAGVFVFCVFMGILVVLFPNSKMSIGYDEFYDTRYSSQPRSVPKADGLTYYGDQLDFSADDIVAVLNRHSVYYNHLDEANKKKFLKRVVAFINDKIFTIHDRRGFKEMPILISAAATQLSFGLKKYLLPHFIYIHIYPEEFLGIHPTIRFLEGNVSGTAIHISWKYFLHGFQFPQDGKNVGLHEMAHAYHYQSFGPCETKDMDFIKAFTRFDGCGHEVFNHIRDTDMCLYSNYAKRNFQEFWAESIELFFEKPLEVKSNYPELYDCICATLNQDPAQKFI